MPYEVCLEYVHAKSHSEVCEVSGRKEVPSKTFVNSERGFHTTISLLNNIFVCIYIAKSSVRFCRMLDTVLYKMFGQNSRILVGTYAKNT